MNKNYIICFLFLCCQAYIFPDASALLGFIQMSVGALMSAMLILFHDNTILPMTGVMAFCPVSAFLIYT